MVEFLTSVPGVVCVVGLLALIVARIRGRTVPVEGATEPRIVMQILVSIVILWAGLYIVLSGGYEPDTEKWAFGVIGTVVGYWLPG